MHLHGLCGNHQFAGDSLVRAAAEQQQAHLHFTRGQGRNGYDVVVATGDLLPNLIKAGVLQELDPAQLPNRSHLAPDILAKMQSNDPGNRYAVPYLWGTTGVGYDVDKVRAILGADAPVDSWDLIFKPENLSKLSQCGVAILDAPSEIIPIALHYLGLPYNSTNSPGLPEG